MCSGGSRVEASSPVGMLKKFSVILRTRFRMSVVRETDLRHESYEYMDPPGYPIFG